MMKSIAFAAALAIIPASAYAQSYGPIIRDPAGGSMRDPALADYGMYGYGAYGYYDQRRVIRDPVGGAMIDDSPRFRTFATEQSAPRYRYDRPVVVGTVLPREGLVYRDVPQEYGAPAGYRYTIVNDRPVIIEPRTRRVVQIIE